MRAALDLNLLEEQIGEECATLYNQAPQIALPPCIVSDIAQLPSTQAKSPFPAVAQAVGLVQEDRKYLTVALLAFASFSWNGCGRILARAPPQNSRPWMEGKFEKPADTTKLKFRSITVRLSRRLHK